MPYQHGIGRAGVTHPTPRLTRRWREDEIDLVAGRIVHWRLETLAERLGRTPRAVEALQSRRKGLCATQQEYLTARQLAFEVGLSPQYVETLCRRGRIRAHRRPGGRVWLVSPREVRRLLDRVKRRHNLPGTDQDRVQPAQHAPLA